MKQISAYKRVRSASQVSMFSLRWLIDWGTRARLYTHERGMKQEIKYTSIHVSCKKKISIIIHFFPELPGGKTKKGRVTRWSKGGSP